MERLTKREETGEVNIIGVDSASLQYASYETALKVSEALHRLAMYEDFQEQGKLQIFPCKLGDTAFWVSEEDKDGNDIPTIHETQPIDGIAFMADGMYTHTDGSETWDKIGERYALITRKQAEQFVEKEKAK